MMPRDVPLVSDEDRTTAFRLNVQAVADDSAFVASTWRPTRRPP
jgi:hypothetical protein